MTREAPATPWWQSAVVYQVYLRSFADGSGNGTGDIRGLLDRLPHVVDLGVDAVWISPWYRSPMHDGGYDVADYRDIDPTFGTTSDALELIDRCHHHGLRVLIDLVANHTSTDHPWFRAALSAPPGSPERQRYHFRPGRGDDGDEPPNNWVSAFGGPAWTRVTEPNGDPGEWYLHLFSPHQPDLDWDCPEVVSEFDDIIRHWLDLGVDGIRVDAASALAKDEDLPSVDLDLTRGFTPREWPSTPFWDVDRVHDILRRWRAIADSYPGDRWLVGEVVVATPERLARYLRPDELHSAFAFDLLHAPWDASAVRAAIDRGLAAVGEGPHAGALTWVLSNHDETRHVTRYAPTAESRGERSVDLDVGRARARAALLLLLALPGATCLYQGEELGLPEVLDLPPELRRDPSFHRTGGAVLGRDGSRVPLPWSGEQPPFDFTTARPWLPQPGDWATLTAASQRERPASTLSFYRDALRLRRRLLSGRHDAPMCWRESPPGTLVFDRPGALTCVVNLTADPIALDGRPVLLSQEQDDPMLLPPGCAAWLAWPGLDQDGP